MFGHWDAYDPVSHCILDLVEAQRELSDAIADDLDYGIPHTEGAAVKAAVEKRDAAGKKLMDTLADRDCWPDPQCGRR
jgi:hypothetical protein